MLRIIDPCVYVQPFDPDRLLRSIELAGRVCYKSEDRITADSAEQFVRKLISRGHESVLEHEKITVKFVTDRATANQIVRHRLCSYSQESTRYCNYASEKFGQEITVIRPVIVDTDHRIYQVWRAACQQAETAYFQLLSLPGVQPEDARFVLPHSLKTELFMTANIREWRHVLRLRAACSAHPEMRRLMIPLLLYFRQVLRPLFEDIPWDYDFPSAWCVKVLSLDDDTILYEPITLS